MTLLDTEKVWVMPLCDIPLEPSYKNPLYFDEQGVLNDGTYKSPTRATFFEKYDSSFDVNGSGYQEVNFSLGDTLNTSVTLEVTSPHKLNANYMHVIWSKVDEQSNISKLPNNLFYFVKGVRQLTGSIFQYQLELDVITTYSPYLRMRGNKPLLTERKHCNRWGVSVIDELSRRLLPFKTGAGADALLGDDIDGRFKAEKLVAQTQINFDYKIPLPLVDIMGGYDALNVEDVETWLYVFVLKGDGDYANNITEVYNNDVSIQLPFRTYIAPLKYKEGKKPGTASVVAVNSDVANYWVYLSSRLLYMKYVSDVNLIGIKVSNISPFSSKTLKYRTSSSGKSIIRAYGNDTSLDCEYISTTGVGYLICGALSYDVFSDETLKGVIPNDLPYFNYSDYSLGQLKNNDYEPKLYTTPYYRFGLKLNGGDIKDYDKLMTFDNGFDDGVITKQGLVLPDSQKAFYSIDTGVYKNYYKTNIGLTFNPAYSLPMVNDVYKNFIATQGQQQLQAVTMGTIGGVAQIGLGLATAGIIGSDSAILKGAGGVSSGFLGMTNALSSYNAKRQDMKSAPDTISKMGQNVLTDTTSNNMQECYVIEYDLIDKEKKMVADYFYENGYKVNRECVFSWSEDVNEDDWLITRTLFNFVKINDEAFMNNIQAYETKAGNTYSYSISPVQRNALGSIFAKGVTLWTLYVITSGNDIDKYYLSKQYENMELPKIINAHQYASFSYTFSGCEVGEDASFNFSFEAGEEGYYFDDLPIYGYYQTLTPDDVVNRVYDNITMYFNETSDALKENFNISFDGTPGKIIFTSKVSGVLPLNLYDLSGFYGFVTPPTATKVIIQEGK